MAFVALYGLSAVLAAAGLAPATEAAANLEAFKAAGGEKVVFVGERRTNARGRRPPFF